MEFIFMIFGLGFFIFVIWMVESSDERRYQRKLMEHREFGRQVINDDPPPKHSKTQ